MEDGLVGGVTGGGVSDSPAAGELGSSSRRRIGGQKRKSSAIASSIPVPPNPSKRATREKGAVPIHPVLYHNGPLTRAARNSPGSDPSPASPPPSLPMKFEVNAADASVEEVEDGRKLEELEAAMERKFETIRSRDSNAHVVPSHCGWFSWSKIHSVEERSLPSFFSGKLEARTPDSYLKIRNWIMKKFHSDPNVQIEERDLNELEKEEEEAKKEVWEFLDRWGLINFNPFPKFESLDENGHGKNETKSMIDNFFHFEAIPAAPALLAPKGNLPSPSPIAKLLIESAMLEELSKAEGPSVEYHCNSCAADCSGERYHCQKQADYDLCASCFSNGKFDFDMSSSDFILMGHADTPGIGGGKWTDQETLLLLEAIEIFQNNWSEIAEHVATKTKAQCLLHFLQMPIEDSFLESNDNNSAIPKGTQTSDEHAEDVPATKEVAESSVKVEKEASQSEGDEDSKIGCAPKVDGEPSKSEDVKVEEDMATSESFAVKALSEAFEAVGYTSTSDCHLSFANVGNPVMALALFLAKFVGCDLTTASTRCSLKSLSYTSPGIHLASRHCFLLEDPPDGTNESNENCMILETVNHETQHDLHHNEEDSSGEKVSPNSCSYDSCQKSNNNGLELDDTSNHAESFSKIPKDSVKESDNNPSKNDCSSSPSKIEESSEHAGFVKDVKIEAATCKNDKSVDPKCPKEDLSKSGKLELNENGVLCETKENNSAGGESNADDISALKSAAVAALSAAAVKAKLLADEEEDLIQQLTASIIEKQLRKLEMKLSFFHEMENAVTRVREQLEKSRQKLFQERAQIIAKRLGYPPSSRPMAPSLPANRFPLNYPNLVARPPMAMNQFRPPIPRPIGSFVPHLPGHFPSGSSFR